MLCTFKKNNKDVGVIMDTEKYKELIASSKKLQRKKRRNERKNALS